MNRRLLQRSMSITVFLFIGLLFYTLSVIIKQNEIIRLNQSILWEMENSIHQSEIDLFKQKSGLKLVIQNNEGFLNPNTAVISEDLDTTSLSCFSSYNSLVVFRYSNLHCNECVDSQLVVLREFEDVLNKQIVMFTSFDSPGELGSFKRIHQIDIDVFDVELIAENLDGFMSPYFFRLNTNCMIDRIFFPDKNDPDLTRTYLKEVLSTL